jgi:hypothetical protein
VRLFGLFRERRVIWGLTHDLTAIELLFYFKSIGPLMLNALVRCLTACLEDDDAPSSDVTYCVDVSIVQFTMETITYPTHIASLPAYVGFLLSIFMATAKLDAEKQPSWSRTKAISRSVAWCLHGLRLGSNLLHLFDDTILKLIVRDPLAWLLSHGISHFRQHPKPAR